MKGLLMIKTVNICLSQEVNHRLVEINQNTHNLEALGALGTLKVLALLPLSYAFWSLRHLSVSWFGVWRPCCRSFSNGSRDEPK